MCRPTQLIAGRRVQQAFAAQRTVANAARSIGQTWQPVGHTPPAGARSADKVGKLTFVSFPGRSPAGNIAPPISAGDDRCFEVNQHSDKLMACQISTSTEMKDVLPEWILAAKTEYEEACRSRMSPDVFPDLSR